MEDRIISPTSFTPRIELSAAKGIISLTGRSTPENALEFYRPVLRWIADYVNETPKGTTVNLQLDYFNSSSSKCILDLIRAISRVETKGQQLIINWLYQGEDIDMRDAGIDLQSLAGISFNFKEA